MDKSKGIVERTKEYFVELNEVGGSHAWYEGYVCCLAEYGYTSDSEHDELLEFIKTLK